jgi:predicted PurR-regulated permease PerM
MIARFSITRVLNRLSLVAQFSCIFFFMRKSSLFKWALVLIIVFLSFSILIYAKSILLPLTLGGLLAMLFMPLCRWFERKGVKRAYASLFCIIVFLLILGTVTYFFVWQITSISRDITEIETNVNRRIDDIQQFFYHRFGISPGNQKKILEGKNDGSVGAVISAVMGSLIYFITRFIIMLVYIFMLLYARGHLKNFILKMVTPSHKVKTEHIIFESSKATQHYLLGFALLVTVLWLLYGVAFSIIGVRNAFFFAALCGLLEVIPFIGSLFGIILTMLMVVSQTGGGGMLFAVFIVYVVVQFTQFYIIQPLLLGGEVNVNPLFAITVLILGEMVWGLGGMIMAIPLTGMIKIICDNVEELHPYGYLLGKSSEYRGSIFTKIRKWISGK